MNSLVPDYGTESEEESNANSDSDSSSSSEQLVELTKPEKKPSDKLIGAATVLLTGTKTEVVLQNPYKLAEAAKFKQLEQHVKMVDTKNAKRLNGKKICFSFQKGKCRFGAKCLYAHDELATEMPTNTNNNTVGGSIKQINKNKRPAKKGLSHIPFKKRA